MIKTPLCDMLGVEHPIMLAGMGGVSYAEVVAAVSNAGGFGTLGMAGTSAKLIEAQMQRVRELTDKPFGVDLLSAQPDSLTAAIDVIIANGAKVHASALVEAAAEQARGVAEEETERLCHARAYNKRAYIMEAP